MSASLVGSEMCIRDSPCSAPRGSPRWGLVVTNIRYFRGRLRPATPRRGTCLLYTSDAADDM
eukprot:3567376-Alexandrium_andersonii.AAC.1